MSASFYLVLLPADCAMFRTTFNKQSFIMFLLGRIKVHLDWTVRSKLLETIILHQWQMRKVLLPIFYSHIHILRAYTVECRYGKSTYEKHSTPPQIMIIIIMIKSIERANLDQTLLHNRHPHNWPSRTSYGWDHSGENWPSYHRTFCVCAHIFNQEIAFENIVCKMSAILFRPQSIQWINLSTDVTVRDNSYYGDHPHQLYNEIWTQWPSDSFRSWCTGARGAPDHQPPQCLHNEQYSLNR